MHLYFFLLLILQNIGTIYYSGIENGKTKSIQFQRILIDTNFSQGYQIKSADLNGDGLIDLVAVSTRMTQIYWYQNPSWEKHLLYDKTRNNIDIAPMDVDEDGDIDLALASRFNLGNSTEGGYIHWLENTHGGVFWEEHFIDSIPTSHRLRWADIDEDGKDELINLPIIGRGAERPDYKQGVEFTFYKIPETPSVSPWSKHIIDTSLHMAHGIQLVQGEGSRWTILTASFEGVSLFTPPETGDGNDWTRLHLGAGHKGVRPGQGSSEVGLGQLPADEKFIATIEPWHGNEVVTYRPPGAGGVWQREVIDTSFNDGHALVCLDLDGDGVDEIIAGHRGKDYHLYYYQFDQRDLQWIRHNIDQGGMSAAGLCVLDFNQDGRMDIAAAGSATNNIVLYENLGKK